MAHLILRLGSTPIVPFPMSLGTEAEPFEWRGGKTRITRVRARRKPGAAWRARAYGEAMRAARRAMSRSVVDSDDVGFLTFSGALLAIAARQLRASPVGSGCPR